MSTAVTAPSTASPAVPIDGEGFRAVLEDLRADCVGRRDLALAEAATAVPDPVAIRRAASLAHRIDEIDAALQRIAGGSYGWCVHCGAAIPQERLEFRPFAARCVRCEQTT